MLLHRFPDLSSALRWMESTGCRDRPSITSINLGQEIVVRNSLVFRFASKAFSPDVFIDEFIFSFKSEKSSVLIRQKLTSSDEISFQLQVQGFDRIGRSGHPLCSSAECMPSSAFHHNERGNENEKGAVSIFQNAK